MDSDLKPKHWVVAGAGFVGGALVRILEKDGHRVTPVTRDVCDLTDWDSVARFAGSLDFDVDGIVHCASSSSRGSGMDREEAYRAIYLEGCRNLLAAFEPGAFVFTSSTSVYAQQDGGAVTEDSPANPDSATGQVLREVEDDVLAAGFSVARLAGIYGPGRSFLLKKFHEGEAVIDGNDPDSQGRWINQIHRDDAASALALLLTTAGANGIHNVSDSEPMRQRAFYAGMIERFGGDTPPVAAPDPNRKRGWSDKAVSNEKLLALGWQPKYPSYFDALDAGAVSVD